MHGSRAMDGAREARRVQTMNASMRKEGMWKFVL